jgi:tetratricopeptide (TPR) repeat protein
VKRKLVLTLTIILVLALCSESQRRRTSIAGMPSFAALSKEADLAREGNRDEDAIQLYRRALALKPDWQEGLWYLGSLLYEKEQYVAACDVLRVFVSGVTDAGPGWALLGMSEFQTREYGRALDHLQRALALGLGDRTELAQSVRYFYAVLLTRAERYDEGLNFMFRMMVAGDDKVRLTEPIGLAALRMPFLPSEIPADRRDLVRMAGQGAIASQTPEHKDAEDFFKTMVKAFPDESGVHFLYGVYLLDIRPEDGVSELKKELHVSPSHVPARLRLAAYYLQKQELDESLKFADEAVKLDPHYPPAHMMLGEVQVAKGDVSVGIKELELARDAQPAVSRVHWDLLRAYSAAGRTEDAEREKQQIREMTRADSEAGTETTLPVQTR